MVTIAEAVSLVDRSIPRCGPCWIHNTLDARHRRLDAIADRPESAREIAEEFGKSLRVIRAIRRVKRGSPKDWRRLRRVR